MHIKIKKNLFIHFAEKYPFPKKFDFVGCFHNLEINDLKFALSRFKEYQKKVM